MLKALALLLFLSLIITSAFCQVDSTANQSGMDHEDPANIRARVSAFSELQALQNGNYLLVSTARANIPIGKGFSTRLDIPYVYYSKSVANYDQYGLGDISLRLLGYQVFQNPKAALIASIECSFNTAASPLLGSGKNIIIPVVAYSRYFPKNRTITAISFQQFYSVSGDANRDDISFTKLQFYYIKALSNKFATLVLPELFFNHLEGDISMNIEANLFYKVSNRIAGWGKGGVGLFGDFAGRYNWTSEIGVRYLIVNKPIRIFK